MHLLEETDEAQAMREKVRNLLLSDEESNHSLALQLIRGGGIHPDFIAPLWGLHIYYMFENQDVYTLGFDENDIDQYVGELIVRDYLAHVLQEDALAFLPARPPFPLDEYLESIQNTPSLLPYWRDIAYCILFCSKGGGKFCFEQQVAPISQLLACLNINRRLYLESLGLESLPPEIAHIEAREIVLHDNPLRKMEASSWVNRHVMLIRIETSISRKQMKILAHHFPHAVDYTFVVMGDTVKREGHHAQRRGEMALAQQYSLQAIAFYRFVSKASRDTSYYHARAHAYNNAGRYRIAEQCYDYILATYANSRQDFSLLYNIACNYARLQNKDKMLEFMRTYVNGVPLNKVYIKTNILSDNDFEMYWTDTDFLALLDSI